MKQPFVLTYTEHRRQPGTYVGISEAKVIVFADLDTLYDYILNHIVNKDYVMIDNLLVNSKPHNPELLEYAIFRKEALDAVRKGGTNGQ